MAPVVTTLAATPAITSRVCVTAQHRDMLDQVLQLFDIEPDVDLDIMRPNQDLAHVTSAVLRGMLDTLKSERPDRILVHGDTTTSFAAALAAYYERIPVGHVEAGLRTGDIYRPFPEEMNRRLADVISDLHFAPTESARCNLLAEGLPESGIVVTGNTVVDALFATAKKIEADTELVGKLETRFPFAVPSNTGRRLVLVTGHRRENFGEGFERVCAALAKIAERSDVDIVYPVHLNPNVQEPVRRLLGNADRLHLIDPVEYLPFVFLMKRAYLVISDSGGIQEEAPSLGKPVLVTREVTERPEAVEAGTVKLVGTDTKKIVSETMRLLDDASAYEAMSQATNPFGDGHASERIVRELLRHD